MPKPEYTSLSELHPATCNLPLPEYVDAARIGVDMERIGKIAAWGGFKSDVRITSVQGETTDYSVGISGQSGGGATASGAGTARKEPTVEGQYSLESQDGWRPVPSLTLRLNSAEITDRIQRKKQPIREPKTWARQADYAVRKGLFDASWRNMVGAKPTKGDFYSLGVTAFGATYFGLLSESIHVDLPRKMVTLSIPSLVELAAVNIPAIIQLLTGATMREAHISLVPIWHVDRAVIATAALARRKLIKAI